MLRSLAHFVLGLAALLAGATLGWLELASPGGPLQPLGTAALGAGSAWLAALSILVVPVSVAAVAAAMAEDGAARAGRSVATALPAFCAALVAASLLTIAVIRPVLSAFVTPMSVQPVTAAEPAGGPKDDPVERLTRAASFAQPLNRRFLPILAAAALAGLLLGRSRSARARAARAWLARVNGRLLAVVRTLLLGTPVALFAIGVAYGGAAGIGMAGILGEFTLTCSLMLIAATVALYPITRALSGIDLLTFARAAWPPQVVALTTRSSLMAVPALLESAEHRLGLPPAARATLSLGALIFRLNRPISALTKLFFVAHVYGIALSPATIAIFTVTVLLQSFAMLGIPGGGSSFKTLPAYLAAGLPIEAIVLLEAAEAATDVFKTLINVTGNLAVAAAITGAGAGVPVGDRTATAVEA